MRDHAKFNITLKILLAVGSRPTGSKNWQFTAIDNSLERLQAVQSKVRAWFNIENQTSTLRTTFPSI